MKFTTTMIGAAAIVASTGAFADTVDMVFEGKGLGRIVETTYDGDSSRLFAGQLIHAFSNGTGSLTDFDGDFITYCVEFTSSVATTVSPFERLELKDGPDSGPMGETRAAAVQDLFAFAGGEQFTDVANEDTKDYTAAFQLTLWELVTDYDGSLASLDMSDGTFQATEWNSNTLQPGVQSWVDEMFASIGLGNSAGVFIVSNGQYQDQAVASVVPLPAPFALGAAGLAGVIAHRRRTAKRAE